MFRNILWVYICYHTTLLWGGTMKKILINTMLICILVFTSSFLFADTGPEIIILDEVVELEYGTNADPDFMDYDLSIEINNVQEENLEYISSRPGIVSVNKDGLLKSRNYGKALITVRDTLSGVEDTIQVEVFLVGDELTPLSGPLMNEPYMEGYPGGKFGPDQWIKRSEVAMIFARLLNMNLDFPGRPSFNDVEENAWYYPGVQAMARANIFLGDEEGNFRPEAFISRAEMASALDQYYKYIDEFILLDKENIIYDVLDDHWAKSSIYKVVISEDMVLKSDNKFYPEDFITRSQATEIINRLTDREPYTESESQFIDVSKGDDYFGHIEAATKAYFIQYE